MLLRRSVFVILAVFLFFFSGSSNSLAGTVTYTYDDENRLVGVSNSVSTVQYSYDILGNMLNIELPGLDLSVIPNSHSFGDVAMGTISSPVMLIISSVGSEALTISAMSLIGTDASMFHMSLSGTNPCPQDPFSLGFQESCTVELTFAPTSSGAKDARLRISSNDPDTPDFDIPLSGNGLPFYILTIGKTGSGTGTVESLDGGIACGTDCSEAYIEGTGITLTAIHDTGSYFDGWTGGGCAGIGDCTLIMTGDTLIEAAFSNAAHISVTPSSHNYGSVAGGESASQLFTVLNDGYADLLVESITVSGADAGEFDINSDNCSSTTLQPTESCQFGVTFAPSSFGSRVAVVEISSNDPNTSVYNVSLTGTGSTEPNIRVRSVLLEEGFVAGIPATWNSTGAWSTANPCGRTLDSPFEESWAIADSLCNSDASGELTTPTVDASICNAVTLAFTNQFDQYGSSQATVDSNPDGQTWNTEEIMSTDSQYPTAGWKELNVSSLAGSSSAQIRFGHTAVNEADGYWAVDNVWTLCEPPQLQFKGYFMDTTAPESVEVRNEGFSNLVVSSVVITGTDSGDFSIQSEDCTAQSLATGASCLVDIAFTASSYEASSATLSISSDDPDTPTVNVPLSGTNIDSEDFVVRDLFTDTNGTALNSHLPDIDAVGTGWESMALKSTYTPGGGIIQNAMVEIGTNNGGHVIDSGLSDAVIEVDWTPAVGADNRGSLIFRASSPGSEWALQVREPNQDITLKYWQNDSETEIKSKAYFWNGGQTYHLKVVASGDNIKCYVDSVLIFDETSSVMQANTKHGFARHTATDGQTFDNFQVAVLKFRDLFTDTNGTALNSHLPDIDAVGTGWESMALQSNFTPGGGTIQNNMVEIGMDNGGHVIDSSLSDAVIEADWTPVVGAESRGSLIFRASSPGNEWALQVREPNQDITLKYWNKDVQTEIKSKAYPWNEGQTYHLKVVASGDSIKCYVDGMLIFDETSPVMQANTKHGFARHTATDGQTFDNFQVTTLE